MRATLRVTFNLLVDLAIVGLAFCGDPSDLLRANVGQVHMSTSCSPSVSENFDTGLALLHNFWYSRARSTFHQVIRADPECAIVYWGAAMTYNHPFWDAPTKADEQNAWELVQKGIKTSEKSAREQMYLEAVEALYRDGGAGEKSARDQAYMKAMAAAYAKYPDNETKLFYALSILGTIEEGSPWSTQQQLAAQLIEQVYAAEPLNPGALHYMIHAYDYPAHASRGLKAARAYAQVAPAVPHALHMPSHIFTRLGYWEESAVTNEKAWRVSETDIKAAGESGAYRDFHSLNYLQYAYIQQGRYRDAKTATDIFAAEYAALPNKRTHADTPNLEVRHLRGRTIYAQPDRVVYGYFDTLARYIIESGEWQLASSLPSELASRDFVAMRLQIETMAHASRKDASAALAAANKMVALSNQPGQHPLAQKVITIQAKEAQALAAQASDDAGKAIAIMNQVIAIEDSIYALSQPPYPPIPAHELYGEMLMEMNRPAEAEKQFAQALERTPGRPKAIYGLARSAEAQGDNKTAAKKYEEFLEVWRNADRTLPEIDKAKQFGDFRGGQAVNENRSLTERLGSCRFVRSRSIPAGGWFWLRQVPRLGSRFGGKT